jgi:hypothetical protein
MATSEEKWSIDKLDGTNWTTWKFQMRHMLLSKGLWGMVDGTDVLADGADAPTQSEHAKRSQKAFSSIVMAVSAPQLYLITSTEEPKEAWDTLRNHYERETLANKLFLKKRYFRTEMKEGALMESHLKHMKEITDQLAAIGAPISQEDQVVTLLGSLPRSYSTLVTALEARGDDLTLTFVQQALVQEEQKRLNGRGSAIPSDNSSAAALLGDSKRYVNPRKAKCFNCGQVGHFRRDCPRNYSSNKPSRHYQPTHKAKAVGEKPQPENKSNNSGTGSVFAASAESSVIPIEREEKWLIDSGASSHMTNQREHMSDYQEFKQPEKVGLGDGRTVDALGIGKVHVHMSSGRESNKAVITNVLLVPKLACSLFSVRAATSTGSKINFGTTRCWIRDANGKLCGTGTLENKLYQLHCKSVTSESTSMASRQGNEVDLWHQRLGHLNHQYIKKIVDGRLATGIKFPRFESLSFCEGCIEGKMHRAPFKPVGEVRSQRKLELVHSDVCGPMSVESMGGQKYFVTFIDDYSRCCTVYFLRHKSEVLEKFKEFEAAVTNEAGTSIAKLRTDNGGEYLSTEFTEFLKSKGIRHELTVPHSPEQNGVSERMNRTLMECARSMIAHAGVPNNYWAEAVNTAAYLKNRTPTSSLKECTPFEKWCGIKPKLCHLKVFGCIAYAHIPDVQRQKLDKKSKKFRFVGYSKESKGYRLLDEQTNKVFIRRDVTFNEIDFGCTGERTDPVELLIIEEPECGDIPREDNTQREDDIQRENDPPIENEQSPQQPRRSGRRKCPPVKYGIDEYADHVTDETEVQHVAYNVCQIPEPTTIEEAFKSRYANEWKQATDAEYQALIDNKTWELVKLPAGCKPIGCKWIFKVKHGTDGKVERFKSRLVAKGYAQQYGIDYYETFSPVVRFSTIRVLLAFAVENDMLIHQMDVVTAFLNGELDEVIYMNQPEGYITPGNENLVCRLKKSLYGLKQSPRSWNTTFVSTCLKQVSNSVQLIHVCIFTDSRNR